ncbi:hypothetical protein D9M72_576740 [compost metagenome]
MGSVLHGSARTTPRLRAELQASKESTRTLAVRYGLNPKTVAKWRARATTLDAPMGPRSPSESRSIYISAMSDWRVISIKADLNRAAAGRSG